MGSRAQVIVVCVSLVMNARMVKTIYDFSAKTLAGEVVSLSKYKGKVVLIENTASL